MYYLTVVFEKGDVVGGRFDAQHDAVLVVHFDGGLSHGVLDTCSLEARVKIVAHFVLVVTVKLAAQKGGDGVGFDGVGGGPNQFLIQGAETGLAFEYDVGSILDLHQTPVVAVDELVDDGAVGLHDLVQRFVQAVGTDGIGEFLGGGGIVDADEGVVEPLVAYFVLVQLSRQFIVTVEVELQPERRPSGHPQIAQSQIRQNEVEVVMQALARGALEKGVMRFLVVPRFIGPAWLHRREDRHQAGMITAFAENGLDAFLLAKILLPDEVDFQPVASCDSFGVFTQRIAALLGPLGEIEDTDAVGAEPAGRGVRIPDIHQGSGDDDPVVTRKRKGNLICMAFDKFTHAGSMQEKHAA